MEPENCIECLENGKESKMRLFQVNYKQAVYMCENCGDLYCPDGNSPVIEQNIEDVPFTKEELERIGLSGELLSYFPNMTLPLVNMIVDVSNYRWQKEKDKIWEDFLKCNNEFGEMNVDKETTELCSKLICSIVSEYNKEDVLRIMEVLDEIEGKRELQTLTNECHDTETVKKEFFRKYGKNNQYYNQCYVRKQKRNTVYKKTRDQLIKRNQARNQRTLLLELQRKINQDDNMKSVELVRDVVKNMLDLSINNLIKF